MSSNVQVVFFKFLCQFKYNCLSFSLGHSKLIVPVLITQLTLFYNISTGQNIWQMAWVLIENIAFVSLGQTRLWPLHLTFNTQSRNISGFWHAMTFMFYRSVTEVLSTYAINSMTIYICGVKDSHQTVDFFTKYWSTQASSSSLIQVYHVIYLNEGETYFLLWIPD